MFIKSKETKMVLFHTMLGVFELEACNDNDRIVAAEKRVIALRISRSESQNHIKQCVKRGTNVPEVH